MPKINLIIVLLSTVLFSCVQDLTDSGTSDADGTNLTLENNISQLELDNAMKDSLINLILKQLGYEEMKLERFLIILKFQMMIKHGYLEKLNTSISCVRRMLTRLEE